MHVTMSGTALFVIVIATAFAGVILVWRVASRRHAIPCPSWLGWMVERDNPFAATSRAAYIVSRLALRSGMAVLDAGSGPGRVTIALARAVGPNGAVVAVDLQPGMLTKLASRARDAGLGNITPLLTRLGQGTLAPGSYDRAVMAAVLGEIPDRRDVMAELFRCLRPGGLLAVAESIFDPHFQRRSVVRSLAHEAGFRERANFGNGMAYLLVLERPQ